MQILKIIQIRQSSLCFEMLYISSQPWHQILLFTKPSFVLTYWINAKVPHCGCTVQFLNKLSFNNIF